MNLVSSNNSYYRYKITQISDIDSETYFRRLAKSKQNNKNSFFYEFGDNTKGTPELIKFFETRLRPTDLILFNAETLNCLSDEIEHHQCLYQIKDLKDLNHFLGAKSKLNQLFFTPITLKDIQNLINFQNQNKSIYEIYWSFSPYNPNIKNSATVSDINKYSHEYKVISGLDIFNSKIPTHYELEPETNISYAQSWKFKYKNSKPIISIIIPTYNNMQFICNVVYHLINQNRSASDYEIIIVDDGSTDFSSEILKELFINFKDQTNLQYLYWKKQHPSRGEQLFFRPGLARNLGSRYSQSKYLLFLDSDMIVPNNFVETCIHHLENNDIIQFQRFHIKQDISKSNPLYKDIDLNQDTYIEENNYWSELFFSSTWSELPNYWKYTCTYALGISKANFYKLGLFKKYYISYGFEDTDLGYEAFKNNFKFHLVKLPLLHLTSYDQMQYRNSFTKRYTLLRQTAELFYLQHLKSEIYNVLGNYFRAQKPIKSFIRDLLS